MFINIESIKILLASSVIAGLISVIVSYFTSLGLKKLDFKNEYYKIILKKRIEVYENVERQIAALKGVVLGDDRRPYHVIFSYGEEKFFEFQQNLILALSNGLWLGVKTKKELEKLNNLFFVIDSLIYQKTQDEIELIAKEYYKELSILRHNLENSTSVEFQDLHNIKKFLYLKSKMII